MNPATHGPSGSSSREHACPCQSVRGCFCGGSGEGGMGGGGDRCSVPSTHTHACTRTHALIFHLTPCNCHRGASVFDGLMVSWGSQIREEEISMCFAKPPDGREEAGLGGGGALLSRRRRMPSSLESWELAQVTSQDCPHSLRRTQKQRGSTVKRRPQHHS